MRRRVAQVARKTPGGRTLLRWYSTSKTRLQTRSRADRLVSAGVVDVAWYEAQTGRSFESATEAARHYLTRDRTLGLSIHPFLEPVMLGGKHWRNLAKDPVLTYLDTPPGKAKTYPNFDEAAWYRLHPEAADHPGKAVGHFHETATPDTPIPVRMVVPGPELLWGAWHARAVESIGKFPAWHALTGARVSHDWDSEREQQFLAATLGLPLPERAGGPLVSVVMPVRNRPQMVVDALKSVQAQSLTDWEVLVVDDGSTDDTPDVVAELAAADPRIRLIRRQHEGVCASRNAGIDAAQGRYVAFLDSDNTWRPSFLDVGLRGLLSSGARAGYAALAVHDGGRTYYRDFEGGREHLLLVNHIDQNVLLAERSLLDELGGFDPTLRRWVDHDLVLRISAVTELAYLPFLGADIDDSRDDRISTRESEGWSQVVLQKHMIDWAELSRTAPERVKGRVSVVMTTVADYAMTFPAVDAVLEATPDVDVEVVVVDNGSARYVAMLLDSVLAHLPRVTLVRNARNLHLALGSNLGLAASTGEYVVLLGNDTLVRRGWLEPLLRELEDTAIAGVAPLLLHPDGTVAAAGFWFPGDDALPTHLLEHHPADDARKLGTIPVRAVAATALAMRAEVAIGVRGLDPLFLSGWEDVDLCLRLGEDSAAPVLRVATDSEVVQVENESSVREKFDVENRRTLRDRWKGQLLARDRGLWEQRGFEVVALDTFGEEQLGELAAPRAVVVRPPVVVRDGLPQLRWAIKIGAGAGPLGDVWGDTHFAADLGAALERLGQDVVVDRREAFYRRTGFLDDVTLTLRGLSEVKPQPGRVNLLWVISHPDIVSVDELRRFDRAFAASDSWAAAMSTLAGIEVEPLLQATNPSIFHPGRANDAAATPHDVLYVGSARGRFHAPVSRPAVDAAIAEGVHLTVYGQRWGGLIPADMYAGDYIANDQLGSFYASAQVLLCDHHADMASEGFAANRLFDAVASGTRVVSDRVVGADAVFGPLVQWFDEPGDLRRLLVDEREQSFLGADERRAAAVRFGQDHSFDARARVLLERAAELHRRAAAS